MARVRLLAIEDLLCMEPLFNDEGVSLCRGDGSLRKMKITSYDGKTSYRNGCSRRWYESNHSLGLDLYVELLRDYLVRLNAARKAGLGFYSRNECKVQVDVGTAPRAILVPREYGYRIHRLSRGGRVSTFLKHFQVHGSPEPPRRDDRGVSPRPKSSPDPASAPAPTDHGKGSLGTLKIDIRIEIDANGKRTVTVDSIDNHGDDQSS